MMVTNMVLALLSVVAFAQEGILPGEPDPNTSPRSDNPSAKACPKGQQRYQQFKCMTPEEQRKNECPTPSPFLECYKKAPRKPRCPKGKTPVAVQKC